MHQNKIFVTSCIRIKSLLPHVASIEESTLPHLAEEIVATSSIRKSLW